MMPSTYRVPTLLVAALPLATGAVLLTGYLAFAALPPVPVPPENPMTESKRVLGKMLFWDEQLSTSNVMSCGTCHIPSAAGTDNRIARNPGPDGLLNTPDDIRSSPGIIRSDAANNFERDPVFALNPQLTGRASKTMINAAYSPLLFWDGRASGEFRDPLTNEVVIASGGALESQAVGPLLNSVEMAHAGFTWNGLAEKLARVVPLDLATNLPSDLAQARGSNATYPALFAAAFGDASITPARIALAMATYQRTLISDQSPFDQWRAGNASAMTPQQIAGLQQFQQHQCAQCHTVSDDLFTDHSFRNIGVRPPSEDLGRQLVTNNPADRGKFKTPTLRNVALKRTFMHNGQFTTLQQVLQFYARAPGSPPQFADNRDPLMDQVVPLPPQDAQAIGDFLQALTDPRVANQTFPFDMPTLFVDRAGDRNTVLGGGVAGINNQVPTIIVQSPAMLGNAEFRVGLANARTSTLARLGVSRNAPINGRITPEWFFPQTTTSGGAQGQGVATQHWSLTTDVAQPGDVLYMQWFVTDAAAAGGSALSSVGQFRVFCGSSGCPCDDIDFNNDASRFDPVDIEAFLSVYAEGPCLPATAQCNDIDFNNDQSVFDPQDIEAFLRVYSEGPCK